MKTLTNAIVLLFLVTGSASADGTWNERVAYRATSSTSLKLVEPEGFAVTITTTSGDKTGTVPEVFTLPNEDMFVQVTLTAPDGTKWGKKIEIRAKHQAELAVTYTKPTPKAQPAAKAVARNHIGRFVNRAGGCGKAWDRAIRAEFRRTDGNDVLATVELASKEYKDVEIAAGTYDVRISFKDGAAWKFALTETRAISKDGWMLGFGCKPGSKSPILAANE